MRVWSLDGKEQCCIKSHICSKIPAGEQSEEQTDQAAIDKIVYSNRRKLLAVSVGRWVDHIQTSTASGLTKAVVCTILTVGWCI